MRTRHPSALAALRAMPVDRWAMGIVLGSALIYALISFVNHANYRTYALDLGLYSNAAWKYAHLMLADRSMITAGNDPALADHLDLHLMLWAPLTYVFGGWTLLIVQIVAIIFGGVGLYRYARSHGADGHVSRLAMCCGLLFFGTFSAVAFDFHSNVVAAMAIPWYMLAAEQGRYARSWALIVFMIVAKENIGLWVGTIALVLALSKIGSAPGRRHLLAQAMMAFAWSFLAVLVIMPALSSTGHYDHSDYQVLRGDPCTVISWILGHPITMLRALFQDVQAAHPQGTAIKLEFWILLFIAGGWALLFSWRHSLMAAPLLLQKMLHDDPDKWGITGHYSIEFAVLLPIAMLGATKAFPALHWKRRMMGFALAMNVGVTFYMMDLPVQPADHARIRFYQSAHYARKFDEQAVRRALAIIPDHAAVSALSPLVPHLCMRARIREHPIVDNADYIALLTGGGCYPLGTEEEYRQRIDALRRDPAWVLKVDDPSVLVFKRSNVP